MVLSASELRRSNFAAAVKAAGGSPKFCEATGLNPDYVRQLLNGKDVKGGRNIGDRAARKIEQLLGKPRAWLDHPQDPTSLVVREPAPTQHRGQDPIEALQYVVGALLLGLSETRPIEVAAVARLLREKAPPEYRDQGFVAAMLGIADRGADAAKGRQRVRPAAKAAPPSRSRP